MKAVCIKSRHKNGLKNGLMKGKAYEVEKQEHFGNGDWLIVKCDDGIQRLFTKDVFQSISEWREKRLNELGI
jgi:hypothetical protein